VSDSKAFWVGGLTWYELFEFGFGGWGYLKPAQEGKMTQDFRSTIARLSTKRPTIF